MPQIQQCCHDCSCPIGSRWELLSLFSSFICHMLIGLCPNLLCFLTVITFKPHYHDASIAAMYAMKTSASQEQAVQASTGPSPASSTTVLFPDVMEPRSDTSPTKQPRTDPGWEELLTSLAARYIDLTGLDYALQQALRSSPHTQVQILWHSTSLHLILYIFDPESGKDWPHEEITFHRLPLN